MIDLTPLSQNDPAWKNILLGTSSVTIGAWGCLLTGMTILVNGLLRLSETPATLNKKMVDADLLQGSDLIPARVPKVIPGLVFKAFIRYYTYARLDKIDAELLAGRPVLVEVDHSRAPGIQTHWVVVYGKVGKDYLILDPFPYPVETGPVLLHNRYGWPGSLEETILAIVCMDSL